MKVVLIRSHETGSNSRQLQSVQRRTGMLPHLGLGYIHTALRRAGHQVLTIDAPARRLSDQELSQYLLALQPALVGVSTTTPGFAGALAACRAAKEAGATVILGGPHTAAIGADNLVHSCLDFVGVGEGTRIMTELATALEHGTDTRGIAGLVSRETDQGVAPYCNLDEIGRPDRSSAPLGCYHSIMARRPFATMMSSRGCPYRCRFCFKQSLDQRPLLRAPEQVVAEMAELVEDHGVREIMFYDDLFTLQRGRVLSICEQIIQARLRLRWEAPTRVDLIDEELARAMAAAGCVRLRFGIESGDQEILSRMGKSSDLERIRYALQVTRAAGIETFGYFIVGYLGESERQYRRTVDFALQLPLDYASFYAATPLPGTELHQEAVAAGVIEADYWQRFVRCETEHRISFLVPDAEERVRRAYRAFYLRWRRLPSIVKRMTRPQSIWSVTAGLLSLACAPGRDGEARC